MQLNEGLNEIRESAFDHCAIESILLPSKLKRIESWAFYKCDDLKCVEIPNGVESIGKECFQFSRIEKITLPNTLKEIGEDAFTCCSSLKTIYVEEGCALDIRKYVGSSVRVYQK